MIPVVDADGVGEQGSGGTYRLMSIGNGEYALFQIDDHQTTKEPIG